MQDTPRSIGLRFGGGVHDHRTHRQHFASGNNAIHSGDPCGQVMQGFVGQHTQRVRSRQNAQGAILGCRIAIAELAPDSAHSPAHERRSRHLSLTMAPNPEPHVTPAAVKPCLGATPPASLQWATCRRVLHGMERRFGRESPARFPLAAQLELRLRRSEFSSHGALQLCCGANPRGQIRRATRRLLLALEFRELPRNPVSESARANSTNSSDVRLRILSCEFDCSGPSIPVCPCPN